MGMNSNVVIPSLHDTEISYNTFVVYRLWLDHRDDITSLDISPLYHMDMKSFPPNSATHSSLEETSGMKSVWYIHCNCDDINGLTKRRRVDNGSKPQAASSLSRTAGSLLVVDTQSSTQAVISTMDASSSTSRYGGHGHHHIMPSLRSDFRSGPTGVTIRYNDGSENGTRWYLLGGSKLAPLTACNRACYYDSILNQWINITPIPSLVTYAASCVYNNQIYIMVWILFGHLCV
jgi:hypothetical protein